MSKIANISIFTPSLENIRNLQKVENAYYFSSAFEVVLNKHGLIGIDRKVANLDALGHGFVCRETPLQPLFLDSPLIFEGPLHPSIIQALNIETATLTASLLHLSGKNLEARYSLGSSQFTVRKIPSRSEKYSQPYLFRCEDSLWNRELFNYQIYQPQTGWETILVANSETESQPLPVGITNGLHVILGIPIFDLLVFQHAFPPLSDAGYYAMTQSFSTYQLEKWLIQSALELFTQNNYAVVLARKWPAGYSAAFSIRHDFDRPLPDDQLDDILNFYDRRGIHATWFWLKRTAVEKQIAKVKSFQHEIALHSEAPTEVEFQDEVSYFRDNLGQAIQGMTAHGGRGSIGYLGMKHHQWCDRQGFIYGEMLGKNNFLPHSAVAIENGIPTFIPLVLPVVHHSLDAGMKPDAHFYNDLIADLPEFIAAGNHCVLMNHPDLHIPQLKQLIDRLPLENVWKTTIETVCEWALVFKFTSQVDCLDRSINISFNRPLPQASILDIVTSSTVKSHTISPGCLLVKIDLEANQIMTMQAEYPLDRYFDDIADLITVSYKKKDLPVSSAIPTIKNNTESLEKRGRIILDFIDIKKHSLVGELGCGYGFLALAIHKLCGAKVMGFDCNSQFLELGNNLLQKHPDLQEYLSFKQLNYLTEELPKNTFDVLILYGTFFYILGTNNQEHVLQNIYQALKPGGQVFFYHPNFWCPIEPFTKMWFVHWLPRNLGNWLTVRQGKRTLSDLDYQSPFKLKRMLHKVGFTEVNYYPGATIQRQNKNKLSYFFCRYYSMTATRM